jgi:MFS family permease
MMHDEGFAPQKNGSLLKEMKGVLKESFDFGLRKAPIRWMMISAIFSGGVMAYAFYAMQPYLLELYGNSGTYAIAGIAAAIFAGAQIFGGFLVPHLRRIFKFRTSVVLMGTAASVAALFLIGIVGNFWVVLVLLAVWSIVFAATGPVRQSYINGLVPSKQRATVLSSDNLFNSAGGVVSQPALGKVADLWGYPISYIASSIFQLFALPFLFFARRENAPSDEIRSADQENETVAADHH